MAVVLARIAYTYHKRHQSNAYMFPLAANAAPTERSASLAKTESGSPHPGDRCLSDYSSHEKQAILSVLPAYAEEDPYESELEQLSGTSIEPVALYPQYLTKKPVSITIDEVDFPKLNSSFQVFNSDINQQLFTIHRERPSFTNRQVLIDAQTQEPILSVRRSPGTLPVSFTFSDSDDSKILSLNGEFYVPTQGSKATAVFTNAISSLGSNLSMKSSWRNRHAVISNNETGEVLATMSSELLNVKNVVGRRRTYNVQISAGVDMALIVGMFVALDARSS
jgi:hypothetical protein